MNNSLPAGTLFLASLAWLLAWLGCSCAPTQSAKPPVAQPAMPAEPLAVLIAGLQANDPAIQADAARMLGELRCREAVDPLVNYVCTDLHYGKTAGLEALAQIGDASVCPRIRQLMTDPHVPNDSQEWYGYDSVRVAAALALVSLGDDSGAKFLQQIIDANPDDRTADNAQWALYTWFAPMVLVLPDGVPAADKLKQEITFERLFPEEKRDPGQITVICRSLGLLKTEKSLAKLVELLKFHSRYVRGSAAVNLLKASPTAEHMAAVEELAQKDPTEFVRVKASLALALAGDDKYLPIIVKAADKAADRMDPDASAELIHDVKPAVDSYQESLVHAAGVEALGLLHNHAFVPVLIRQLRQTDPLIRVSAIEALDRLGGGQTVAMAVASCRMDENPRVRLAAAKYFLSRPLASKSDVAEDRLLKVGVAVGDIAPPEPALLTPGGIIHVQPTLGVLDDLTARAIAFQAGGKTAFVVIGDQIFLGRDVQIAVSQAVAKEIGCDPLDVLITATHDHSASAKAGDNSGDAGTKALAAARKKVIDGYIAACLAAYKNLRPAEMAAATVWLTEPIGVNRRMHFSNGGVMPCWGAGAVAVTGEDWYGSGLDSKRIDVLSIRQPGQKQPFAILTSYATHIQLLGIPYFSSEFAGRARAAVEARIPGATVVYSNSTAGDLTVQSPLPQPLQDPGSKEAIQWYNDSMNLLGKRFADAVVSAIPTNGYVRPEEYGHDADTTAFGQQRLPRINALTFDNIALVVIPGEMFNTFGDMMHQHSPVEHLLLLGYGLGGVGGPPPGARTAGPATRRSGPYIATVIGYEEGGYEPFGAAADGTRGLDIARKVTEILDRLVVSADERDQKNAGGVTASGK